MKKTGFLLLIITLLFILSGCVTSVAYTSAPVGENVEYIGDIRMAVGPFFTRYIHEQLLAKARRAYGNDVDDVIGISTTSNSYFLFWRFNVEGKAIKYND